MRKFGIVLRLRHLVDVRTTTAWCHKQELKSQQWLRPTCTFHFPATALRSPLAYRLPGFCPESLSIFPIDLITIKHVPKPPQPFRVGCES